MQQKGTTVESLNVRMPRFQVDGEAAVALAAALVDVARRVVEHAQHRHDAVGRAVGAANHRVLGANVVDVQPNPTGVLANHRTLSERLEDALYAVVPHFEQEARRELRMRRA